mmetsp:Transcript_28037/g.45120  ORF Transcript_28037/g.45120 Transcript_28037/m.45120 type:complete len:206 (+) Transcript_28037:2652-3269(+)
MPRQSYGLSFAASCGRTMISGTRSSKVFTCAARGDAESMSRTNTSLHPRIVRQSHRKPTKPTHTGAKCPVSRLRWCLSMVTPGLRCQESRALDASSAVQDWRLPIQDSHLMPGVKMPIFLLLFQSRRPQMKSLRLRAVTEIWMWSTSRVLLALGLMCQRLMREVLSLAKTRFAAICLDCVCEARCRLLVQGRPRRIMCSRIICKT